METKRTTTPILSPWAKSIRLAVRIVAFISIALLILVSTGVLLLQSSLFEVRICAFIERQANTALNGTVHIGGLEGSLFSDITLTDIVLEDAENETVLSIDRLSIRYLLSRLFSGLVHLDSISIEGLRLHLVKTGDDRLNISTLMPAGDTQVEGGTFSMPYPVRILLFEILNSEITYSETDSERQETVTDTTLSIDGIHAGIELSDTVSLTVPDAALTIIRDTAFPVALSGNMQYTPSAATLSLDGLTVTTGDSVLNLEGECGFMPPGPYLDLLLTADPLIPADLSGILPIEGLPSNAVVGTVNMAGFLSELRHNISIRFNHAEFNENGVAGFDNERGIWADLSCRILDLDLSEKWPFPTPYLSGIVSCDMTLDAAGLEAIDRTDGRVTAEIQGLSTGCIPLDTAKVIADFSNSVLTVENLEASSEDHHLSISGNIRPSDRNAQLSIDISLSDSASFFDQLPSGFPVIPENISFDGKTDISASFDGWFDDVHTSFLLNADKADIYSYLASGLQTKGNFCWVSGTPPTFEGISISARTLDSETVSADTVSIDGSWEGLLDTPRIDVNLSARNVTSDRWPAVRGQRFDDITASGLFFQDRLSADLSVEHENGSKAEIEGDFEDLKDTVKEITLQKLHISTESPWIECLISNESFIHFYVGQNELTVDDFSIDINGTALSISGVFSPPGNQNLKVKIANLDIDRLPEPLKPSVPVSGLFSGEATLRGTLSNPVIFSNIRIDGLSGYDIDQTSDLALSAEYADTALSFHGNIGKSGIEFLSASGKLPVSLAIVPFSAEILGGDIAMQLDTTDLKLSELPLPVYKDVEWDATADMSLHVSGTFETPDTNGSIAIRDGFLSLPGKKLTYETLEGKILFHNNQLQIERFLVEGDREGRLTTLGTILFKDLKTLEANLTLNGSDFYIPYKKSITARISPDLHLTGTLGQARLTGDVTITESKLNLDQFSRQRFSEIQVVSYTTDDGTEAMLVSSDSGSNGYLSPLSADILVHVPNNAWLKGQDVNAEISGELSIKKSPGGPFLLSGPLSTLRGDYYFMGKHFQLSEGNLEFMGLREIDPNLYIVGETTIGSKTIIATLHGTASELAIDLSSEPSMEESDIISYLVFGRGTEDLGGDQAFSVEKTALSYTGSLLAVELRNLLGDMTFFDSFAIDSAEDEGTFGSITLGKYISPKIFVSHHQGLSEGESSYEEVHYELTPQIKLETQIGRDHPSSADITWEFDF